ncbi:Alpha/Beta hydrolase protein [Penicillium concentricum]|uniref:Alpha/Beta hydrolase protein n=1 Tax=Penicillium concentricum TaxID=293559 RepID=A0A9W9V1W4_9EURO|nr:Alpha/Beta hydrolase protein [Penicillium concentricum]KAJ5365783.1 Alpha/Beta hydrolase protein [Penicillium concentricum]
MTQQPYHDRYLALLHIQLYCLPIGVRMQMRTGEGQWYWRTEEDWPVPGTEYVKFHLAVDGRVSFISDAFEEDVELAGHFSTTLNILSTSHDADVVILLWAVDESGNVVRFCVDPRAQPLANGFLRASHRSLDPSKSPPYRPWHTHKEAGYTPLIPGEAVEICVEISPATSCIRRGWKLRLEITPSEVQPNIPGYELRKLRSWGKESHDGATNTVHVGGDYDSFISILVIPKKYPQDNPLRS